MATRKSILAAAAPQSKKYFTVHGAARRHNKSPEYKIWMSMKSRCANPNGRAYSDYGGRGITVCQKWRESFAEFLKDMGSRPTPHHTVERKNNDLGYSPDNCKWATRTEQNRNSRHNRIVSIGAESHPLVVWLERLGINYTTFRYRTLNGMTDSKALSYPARSYKRKTA